MFEDSLMESGGKIKTKSKYWSILTLCLNARGTDRAHHLAVAPSRSSPHPDDGDIAGGPAATTATSPATAAQAPIQG